MNIAYVHFYLEDATTWRDWFVSHLGFQAVSGFQALVGGLSPEHTHTEVVTSGSVCFVLSSPLLSTSPVAEFLRYHPPGVADVAFVVEDVVDVLAQAQANGAQVLQPIQQYHVGDEYIKCCKITGWGSLSHTLLERPPLVSDGTSDNLSVTSTTTSVATFTAIDHIVLNVTVGDLAPAIAWYEKTLDFQPQQRFKIQTDRSGLHSQVLVSRHGGVQLPINEPSSANSQIQEFLNVNRGAGIQHLALRTTNIVRAIAHLRQRGVNFLPVPHSYYTQLKTKPGFPLSPEELQVIAQQEILVDWKPEIPPARFPKHLPQGKYSPSPLLLQIFTQPIFVQPTFFFEIIERRFQAQGFGEGNFRALFAAMELEQIKRGSLE
ncbi:MAG: 4-hydroxyphenylpyruvate dioxygenase [Nostocaceae cyanobacterium]|nr:4-hydroxyphenylpyruvate dioxygenase [Nostocaceae cyanobacterium]